MTHSSPTPISALSYFHAVELSHSPKPNPTHLTPACVCVLVCTITRLYYNISLWILQLKAFCTTTQRARHNPKVMQTQVSSQYLLTLESQYSTPIPQHNPTTCMLSITTHTIVVSRIPQVESTHNTTLRIQAPHTKCVAISRSIILQLSHHSTPPTPTVDYNLLTHKRTHSLTHTKRHALPNPFSLLGTNSTRP